MLLKIMFKSFMKEKHLDKLKSFFRGDKIMEKIQWVIDLTIL